MKKYTEKVHAEILLNLLEKPDPCGLCPGSIEMNPEKRILFTESGEYPCGVCRGFVSLNPGEYVRNCPCFFLGKHESIKRSWIALEEKGYI